MRSVSQGGASGCHCFPPGPRGVWLAVGIFAMLLGVACHQRVPALDLAVRGSDARSTLTGVIRASEGTRSLVGRDVQIVNMDTGARHTAQTGENGGFTIQLPAGKYQIDVPLRDGETVVKRPGVVRLDDGGVESRIEVVLASVRVSRPHGPAYRLDNGLGSPIT